MKSDLHKPMEIVPIEAGLDRAASQLIAPHADRKKHVTEHILNFINGKISLAEFAHLSRKKLDRVAEVGYVKLRHGRLDEAHRLFQVLHLIDTNNPYHHLALGSIFQKKRKDTEAIFHYSQCIKKNSKELNAYINRGEIYLRHRNYRKAAQDFRQAILLDPTGRNKYANRARQLVIAIRETVKNKPQDTALSEKSS